MYDEERARSEVRRRTPIFHDLEPTRDDFRAAVLQGLSLPQKALPCRFLYDERGSQLFDRICELPEYYPTRTEMKILRQHAGEMARLIGPGAQLIELGSGSSTKVRILLDALASPSAYVAVDISAAHLRAAAYAIQRDYPDLSVEAICADYSQAFDLPSVQGGRRVGFYPGSTIGNLTPTEAQAFLALWAKRLSAGAAMLVGVDLRKSADILEPAYNDSRGVSAEFSLNMLTRANRELGMDFDMSQFRHEAHYLADEGRIAIHWRSLKDQSVHLGDRVFFFAEGERVHVEDSWKYSLDGFGALARAGGFEPVAHWVDEDSLFSVHLLSVRA